MLWMKRGGLNVGDFSEIAGFTPHFSHRIGLPRRPSDFGEIADNRAALALLLGVRDGQQLRHRLEGDVVVAPFVLFHGEISITRRLGT